MLTFAHQIDEICSSLQSAVTQSIPSDDQIIMGRVREALVRARVIQDEMKAQARLAAE